MQVVLGRHLELSGLEKDMRYQNKLGKISTHSNGANAGVMLVDC